MLNQKRKRQKSKKQLIDDHSLKQLNKRGREKSERCNAKLIAFFLGTNSAQIDKRNTGEKITGEILLEPKERGVSKTVNRCHVCTECSQRVLQGCPKGI